MSKGNGWIPLDKNCVFYLPNDRPYTKLEALFCYQLDMDNSKSWSINGYAKLWQWSRNKVRKFLENAKRTSEGHLKDTQRTPKGQAVHFINSELWRKKDTQGTPEGHLKDTQRYTTIDPNPNKKEKIYSRINHSTAYQEIISHLNQKANTNFRPTTKSTQALIKARLNEGFTIADFKKVIDIKISEWLYNDKMLQYLRPQTLFGSKFESYLNQKQKVRML